MRERERERERERDENCVQFQEIIKCTKTEKLEAITVLQTLKKNKYQVYR